MVPFESADIYTPKTNPQILYDQACQIAEIYIHEKHLEIEGEVVYDLRMFGKEDELLINVDDYRRNQSKP